MRGGISDSGMRSRVVTLHIDKGPFNQALEVEDESQVYLFLVERDGRILEKVEGRFSEDKWQHLMKRF
jgi:hypothetical protein